MNLYGLMMLMSRVILMLIKLSCCDNACVYDDKLGGGGTTSTHSHQTFQVPKMEESSPI